MAHNNHPALLSALSLAGSFIVAPTAWAGRPLVTVDAVAITPQECQWESFLGRNAARGSATARASGAQLGCGLGHGSELALAWSQDRARGASATSALTLQGKTVLNEVNADQPSWALAWALHGERAGDESLKHRSTVLLLAYSHPLPVQNITLHANLGWQQDRIDRQQTSFWSTGLEHGLSDLWDVTADVYGNDRDTHPWAQIGLRWQAWPDLLQLDASLARQSGPSRAACATLGLTLSF
jgi:hypothetical protein